MPERTDPDTVWEMRPVPTTPPTTEEIRVEPVRPTTATREHASTAETRPMERSAPPPAAATVRRGFPQPNQLVTILGSILAVLLALFIVEQASPSWFAGLRNVTAPRAGSVTRTTNRSGTQGTKPPPSSPAGAPVLYSLDPSSAPSGATVTITGNDLFSSNQQVVARFDGRVSSTRCPSTHRCLAVVPALPSASRSVTVRVSTNAGQSNALRFQYT